MNWPELAPKNLTGSPSSIADKGEALESTGSQKGQPPESTFPRFPAMAISAARRVILMVGQLASSTYTLFWEKCSWVGITAGLGLPRVDPAGRPMGFNGLDQTFNPHTVSAATGRTGQITGERGRGGAHNPSFDWEDHSHHLRLNKSNALVSGIVALKVRGVEHPPKGET